MQETRSRFRSNLVHGIKFAESRPREPIYINRFFPTIHKYILQLKAEKPDITVEEVQEILEQDILALSKAIFVGCNAPDAYTEYACSLYLEKHPAELKQLLDRIEKENLKPTKDVFYSSKNFEKDILEYLLILKEDFPNVLQNFGPFLEKTDLREILLSSTLSQEEKTKAAHAYIRKDILPQYRQDATVIANSHLQGLPFYIGIDRQIQEENLKNELVEYISAMIEQLKKFGFLDKYNRQHNKQMEDIGLPDLSTSGTDLDKLLNPNFLGNLPIDELLALSVFWINRYTKEFDTLANALFAVREFDLLPQMLSSQNVHSIVVPKEHLMDMLTKIHTLYYPCVQYFEERQAEAEIMNYELTEEEYDGNYMLYSYEPLAERLQEDFGDEYTKYFSQSSYGGKHDLTEDVLYYAKMQSPIYAAKTTKDSFLTAMLISLEINPSLVNGGIIIDPNMASEEILKQRFIGLATDYNLTAPVRLHIRLDDVRDFLLAFQHHAKIQIYEGNEDFRLQNGQILTNHMILPFDQKMKKTVRSCARKLDGVPDSVQRYAQHLNFLQDFKQVPDHLKTTVINQKGKAERKFVKRYFDLEDGHIYTLKDGEFVLDEPTPECSKEGVDLEDER